MQLSDKPDRVDVKIVQDRQKLDHVEPALAALVLGDVRLRLPKLRRKISLRDPLGNADLAQHRAQMNVVLCVVSARHVPGLT